MQKNAPSAARSIWSRERSVFLADVLGGRRAGLNVAVRLRVYGESMLPTLWPGDVVEIANCSLEDVGAGEIVLAQLDGRLFLHRFVGTCKPDSFLLRGDSMPTNDPPFPRAALLGRLAHGDGEKQGFAGRNRFARNQGQGLGVKLSRAVGMLLCHCSLARRVALKLHGRRKASTRELQNSETGVDLSSAHLSSAQPNSAELSSAEKEAV